MTFVPENVVPENSTKTIGETARQAARGQDFSQDLAAKGWYHSFEFPDGAVIDGYMPLAAQKERYSRYPIPDNLSGKRVLDIGAWDGWFSFEAERHGADVVALDCVQLPTFLRVHRKLKSKVDYRILDFYELPDAGLGKFDIVFFLGVLYHLRHPLLALEMVCALTLDVAIVDSFVIDSDNWQERAGEIPTMEFYELNELGNQFDNWNGPTVACLLAMCRAAGFARVELLGTGDQHAVAACFRTWEPPPAQPASDPPELLSVINTRSYGNNFSTRKSEEYISCVFRTPNATVPAKDLRLEVDHLGARAVQITREPTGVWVAAFRLPPGLDPGWHRVRLRLADSGFGQEFRIAVDMPVKVERLAVRDVCDGVTWARGEVAAGGCLSCWVHGLADNCDAANFQLLLDDSPLHISWIGQPEPDGYRQVNSDVPVDLARGEHVFLVESAGVRSEPQSVKVP
jgi:tRNA (mo5U34)-methyltransferase